MREEPQNRRGDLRFKLCTAGWASVRQLIGAAQRLECGHHFITTRHRTTGVGTEFPVTGNQATTMEPSIMKTISNTKVEMCMTM